jgi:hypothetical protein
MVSLLACEFDGEFDGLGDSEMMVSELGGF